MNYLVHMFFHDNKLRSKLINRVHNPSNDPLSSLLRSAMPAPDMLDDPANWMINVEPIKNFYSQPYM